MPSTKLCGKLIDNLPLFFIIIIPTLYTFITFNRYLPIQEGWFQYYVQLMDNGRVPYRDFFYPLQPFYLILCKIIAGCFGTDLIIMRIYGMFERTFLVMLVYLFLKRYFNKEEACLCTLFGFFLYTSFNVDLPYSYYQTTFLFSVVSIHLLSIGIDGQRKVLFFSAGIFAGLGFFTKQSSGMIILLVNLASIFLFQISKTDFRKVFQSAAAFLAGFSLPALFIIFWLTENDSLLQYFKQVFLSYGSKGALVDILFGFFLRLLNNVKLLPTIIITLSLLLMLFIGRKKRFKEDLFVLKNPIWLTVSSMTLLMSLLFAYYFNLKVNSISIVSQNTFQRIILLTFAGSFVLMLFTLWKWIINPDDKRNKFVLLASVFSFAWMYSHGMSGVLEVHSLMPGFALLLLFVLDLLKDSNIKSVVKIVMVIVAVVLVLRISSTRYSVPYYWWGWAEPDIRTSTVSPNIPMLKGFHLSKKTADVYTSINEMVLRHTGREDDVFAFPHFTIFNVMTNRRNQFFSPVNYFDVCPDKLAIRTAKELEQLRPKIIIYMEFPEEAWLEHEKLFRGGRQSGQRNIMKVINKFIASNLYRVIYISPPATSDYPIKVLVRNI